MLWLVAIRLVACTQLLFFAAAYYIRKRGKCCVARAIVRGYENNTYAATAPDTPHLRICPYKGSVATVQIQMPFQAIVRSWTLLPSYAPGNTHELCHAQSLSLISYPPSLLLQLISFLTRAPSYLAVSLSFEVPDHHHSISHGTTNADSAGLTQSRFDAG